MALAVDEADSRTMARHRRGRSSRGWGASDESPVPFHEDAIAAALEDEARGRRHFPGYCVRAEQVELARRLRADLDQQEVLLAEGGTGVGKSLAYLAAAIPYVMEAEASGEVVPIVISTRTKILQDQLMEKDIGAAARFLGYPDLRAISIKGRANYACKRRLRTALAEGREQSIFRRISLPTRSSKPAPETRRTERSATCRRVVAPLPTSAGLLRRAVASRAEHCSRDECAKVRDCALGRRRQALTEAHLIVANHDLLLRWPPDYPGLRAHHRPTRPTSSRTWLTRSTRSRSAPRTCSTASTRSSAAGGARSQARRSAPQGRCAPVAREGRPGLA